jgi:uncharacterized membrane protein YcaP (DUF421 family)
MIALATPDWGEMFRPVVPLLELVLRGSAMYLFVFTAMRFFRREAGGLGTPDLLVLVLVADAAQNAMAAEYRSLTEGFVLVATIFAWNFGLDWLGFRYRWAHRLLIGSPLPLVRDGRIQWKNLKKEMLTREDLVEQLREQGVEDLAEVKLCNLEADGRLGLIKAKPDEGPRGRQNEPRAHH